MTKELALECRIKEPVTLDNLREVIKEAIKAGGYLTEEKLEEDTECLYNYSFRNNAIMIAFANLLGLNEKLYLSRNSGKLMLPNIKREDCEIISDSSGMIWEILLHQLDNGLWLSCMNEFEYVGRYSIRLAPYNCMIYPSREAALMYGAQEFLDSYFNSNIMSKLEDSEYEPYIKQANEEAEKLGEIRR